MAMSQQTATFLLSLPPVRGGVSLMFLLSLGTVFIDDEMGLAGRLGLAVVLLLLGTVIWAVTLRGFVRDVHEPRRLEHGEVVVAARPRGAARVLSWIALGVLVVGLLMLPSLLDRDLLILPALAATLVALCLATALPKLSRRFVERAGQVAVSPVGLQLLDPKGAEVATIPWAAVGPVGTDDRVARSLEAPGAEQLGERVRWRAGAREAVARWTKVGFSPDAGEVRALALPREWSEDPAAHGRRWTETLASLAVFAWASLVCALLLGAMVFAVGSGQAPWWILAVLGWAPVIALVILVPRLVRVVRGGLPAPAGRGGRSALLAEATARGWDDRLHGQGLVPWEDIERLEIHGGHTLVISREAAPPFRDHDLGNRMNHRLETAMDSWPGGMRIRSAGPLFREIGPRHLPYDPGSGAFLQAERAGREGWAEVRRAATTP